MNERLEYEETLVLKAELGGELGAEERRDLERFLGTTEGRAVQTGVRATRALLRDDGSGNDGSVGVVEVADLRARFETTARERARFVRGRFRGFLLLSFGVATGWAVFFGHVLPLIHPKQPGPGDVLTLWLVLYGGAALFCAYMLYRLYEMERAPDLFDRLTGRERRVPRTLAAHLRKAPIAFLLIALVANQEGWARATIGVLSLWTLFAFAAHFLRARLRRERMGEDAELWSWWYGELDRPPSR